MKEQTKQELNILHYKNVKVFVTGTQEVTDNVGFDAKVIKKASTFLVSAKQSKLRQKNVKVFEKDGITVMTRKDGSLVIHAKVIKPAEENMKQYYRDMKENFAKALEVSILTHKIFDK